MCELLAMSFNQSVKPSLSFRGFRHKGKYNPDGWGLAYYPDEAAQVIKEPIKAIESELSEFIKTYSQIQTKIFIAHVRNASKGEISHKNTHPFQRELNGKDLIFAHNGTLENYREMKIGRFKPIGETDSEYAFCYILNCIEEEGIKQWGEEKFRWLWKIFKEVNNFGNFNCIFSDGEYLFCYHDKDGYNGFCFVKREAPFSKIRLEDEDFEIDLSKDKDPSQKGFVIASKPLTNEKWEDLNVGELIVFKDGDIVFSSNRIQKN